MERAFELVIALLIISFFVALSILGFIFCSMDKLRAKMGVCIKQIKLQLDVWIEAVLDYIKTVECSAEVAEKLNSIAKEYSGYKKDKDINKRMRCLNEMFDNLLLVEGYSPVGDVLELSTDTIDRIEVIAYEYNKCAVELNRKLDKKINRGVAKLFGIERPEVLSKYFEHMYGIYNNA